jgi:hypothetical protein
MIQFERFQFLFYSDTGLFVGKGFRRSSESFYTRPHDARLKHHLWILLRLAAIIATVGLIALLVHAG